MYMYDLSIYPCIYLTVDRASSRGLGSAASFSWPRASESLTSGPRPRGHSGPRVCGEGDGLGGSAPAAPPSCCCSPASVESSGSAPCGVL